MRNKEKYAHTLSSSRRFQIGLLVNVLYTIQIHPS
jgi:hypothetical protein